jgi:hypothetical protein
MGKHVMRGLDVLEEIFTNDNTEQEDHNADA